MSTIWVVWNTLLSMNLHLNCLMNTITKQKQQQQPKAEQSKNNSLTNFARQAERQTRKKLNEAKRQRSLIKNW